VPSTLHGSALNTPDSDSFAGWMVPGAPLDDAPAAGAVPWLLRHLGHGGFTLLFFGRPDDAERAALQELGDVRMLLVLAADAIDALPHLVDVQGLVATRCDAQPGTVYLLRPDQHVAARWRHFDIAAVQAAHRRALALGA
jgi:3-(3-hydroxy-phenyl)propionate hydroxylase